MDHAKSIIIEVKTVTGFVCGRTITMTYFSDGTITTNYTN